MYSSTLPLTSALYGGGWSAPRLGCFTPSKDPVPTVQEAGWATRPVWTGTENLALTGIRSPDRPARNQSLYRLSYPGPTAQGTVSKDQCVARDSPIVWHFVVKSFTTRIMFLLMTVANGRGSELFPVCTADGMFAPDMISGLLRRQCASHLRAVRHSRSTRLSLRVRHPHPNSPFCATTQSTVPGLLL